MYDLLIATVENKLRRPQIQQFPQPLMLVTHNSRRCPMLYPETHSMFFHDGPSPLLRVVVAGYCAAGCPHYVSHNLPCLRFMALGRAHVFTRSFLHLPHFSLHAPVVSNLAWRWSGCGLISLETEQTAPHFPSPTPLDVNLLAW